MLSNERKKSEKPKGPIVFPRGEAEAVQEVIKVAKAKLSVRSSGKKEFWVFVHGGPDGSDKRDSNPIPLADTLNLADGDLVVLSSREVPEKEVQHEGDLGVARKIAETPVASAPDPVNAPPAENKLSNVRAAYERRLNCRCAKGSSKRTPSMISAESVALAVRARDLEDGSRLSSIRVARALLPAAKIRQHFLKLVAESQVVIVSGETGSGKTTQCPHFILEDCIYQGKGGECTIICTQPRRIAAIGVAERVCSERGEEIGNSVGYAVRLDSQCGPNTRLLFCTTGVLLRRLHEDPELKEVTHVVVDEVHERNVQTDFLLTMLRCLLPKRPTLKVVLMSATLQSSLFEDYFSEGGLRHVPIVHIAGRTHPVKVRYIADARAAITNGRVLRDESLNQQAAPKNSIDDELDQWMKQSFGNYASQPGSLNKCSLSRAVAGYDERDYKVLADLVAVILRGNLGPEGSEAEDSGAILIFLPGYDEIKRVLFLFRNHKDITESNAHLLTLHGQMRTYQQRMVFKKPPLKTQRKVVLATNIAETSITIDDVTHVIDTGHVKENRYDPKSRMAVLVSCWVSQASGQQRAGRAGRVRPGVCWRLYGKEFFDELPEHTLCEMRRVALEDIVLQCQLLELGNGNPHEFLRRAPEPPPPASLSAAIRTLEQIGAVIGDHEGYSITPLGFHIAHMPLDVRSAKMLIYGALMRCLSPILTVAACLSEKSPFTRGSGGKDAEKRLREQRETSYGQFHSDHLAITKVFSDWQVASRKGRENAREFCDKYGLSGSTLESMESLRFRYLRHLQDVGFVPHNFELNQSSNVNSGLSDENSKEHAVLRCVVCAGLYPNVAQVQRTSTGKGTGTKTFLVSIGDLDVCAVHPGSLNMRCLGDMQANHGWLLYHSKVKTSQVYLHDSTLIGSFPLLLFGGGTLQTHLQRRLLTLDDQLRFDTGKRQETAVLVKLFRKEIDRLLLMKIEDPSADVSKASETLLKALVRLLRLEIQDAEGLRAQAR